MLLIGAYQTLTQADPRVAWASMQSVRVLLLSDTLALLLGLGLSRLGGRSE